MKRGTLLFVVSTSVAFSGIAGAQGAVPPGAGGPGLPDRSPPVLEGLEPVPGGLTANETARRALTASATVKQKRAEVEAANEKITQTTVQFLPKLTVSASYTRTSPLAVSFGSGSLVGAQNAGVLTTGACPGGPGTCVLDSGGQPVAGEPFSLVFPNNNYVLEGRLSIPISDYILRVSDAAAATSSSRDATRFSLEAERLKVASDARALYFNWLRARAQAAIAHKAVEQTRARLEDARAAFAVGTISKADQLRIEALVANTEVVATNSDSAVALTVGQLAIVMEDPNPAYRVGEGVPVPGDIPEAKQPVGQLTAEALARRLEMRSLNETIKALQSGASASRAGALPRVEALGDVVYANPNPRYFPPTPAWHATWSVGAQATWTFGDTLQNASAAREYDDDARATEAQRIGLRAAIAQEVLSSYLDFSRARIASEKQRTALASAEEAYRVETDLFRAGRATGTDLIAAESDLLNAEFGDVNARIDLTIAGIALQHATGRDVPAELARAGD